MSKFVEKGGMLLNSHILIPKCVLLNFVNEHNQLYKYDIQTRRISPGYPKTTYTSEDYYSEYIEKFLGRYVETPIPRLVEFVETLVEGSKEMQIDKEYIDIASVYLLSLVARNPKTCEYILNGSELFQFLTMQEQHDTAVLLTLNNKNLQITLNKFNVSFMINKTKLPLILPTRGMYEMLINGVICLSVPISSNCAILLIEKDKNLRISNKGKTEIIIVEDENADMIEDFNRYAFAKQNKDGIGYVICCDKKHLNQISNNASNTCD